MATTAPIKEDPSPSQQQTIKKKSFIHEDLDSAQKKLLLSLDSFLDSSSIFSNLSLYWQKMPWWQKITLGSLLALPLIIGLGTQIVSLSLLGLSLVFFSSLSLFLIHDHLKHHKVELDQIKANVLGFVKLFVTMIENLELLNSQFSQELNHIKESNTHLRSKCEELEIETNHLKKTNLSLDQNQSELLEIQKKLHATIVMIDNTVIEQTCLLQKNQALLTSTTLAYQQNQQQLADAVKELSEVKTHFENEVERAKRVALTLKNAVEILGDAALTDKNLRKQFFEKLDSFLSDHEIRFDALMVNIAASGILLSQTAKEVEASSIRFTQLLDIQEEQIDRFTELEQQRNDQINARRGVTSPSQPEEFQRKPSPNTRVQLAPALLGHGFYAFDQKQKPIETISSPHILSY